MRPFDLVLVPPVWLITLWSLNGARHGSRRGRYLCLMWALLCVSVTIGIPDVRRGIDAASGVTGVTILLVHILALSAITAFLGFIRNGFGTEGTGASRLRWYWVVLPLAALALSVLFSFIPRADENADFLTTEHPSVLVDSYWTVYLLYVSLGLGSMVRLCRGYARIASAGPPRTSLRLIGLGCCFGSLYVLQRLLYLVARRLGSAGLDSNAGRAITQILLTFGLLLLGIGICWPALAERLRRVRVRRQAHSIRSLWEILQQAAPEAVLALPHVLQRDVDLLVYRYVIEIRDSSLALEGHLTDERREIARETLTASGVSGRKLTVAVEAALLLYGCQAKLAGTAVTVSEASMLQSDLDLGAEIDWLDRIARAARTARVAEAVRVLRAAQVDPACSTRTP